MRELGAVDTGKLQPSRPVFPVIDVDKRELEHIGGLGKAVAAGKQVRTAHREKLLGAQTHDIEARPVAITVPDSEIDVFARKVDMVQHRRYAQIDARMFFSEAAKPVDPPFGSKVW